MMVFTEPEAQDYWLNPGEEVEIRASVTSADASFEISLHHDGIIIWPPLGMGYISVWQNNAILECGYQRPKGWA